jgi:AraC family transcriptional regulator, arabinose operon regulatory protein
MDQRIQTAIALMETQLQRELSLEEMAQSMNLSCSRLRHLFKAETGVAPAQYLKVIRLRRAQELITTTYLTRKQVMSSVGVHDTGHFAKDFKRIYGANPAEYRNRYREATPNGENARVLAQ